MDEFSTARLLAVRLQESHLDILCHMHQNATVMATLGGVRSAEQTRVFLDNNLTHWQQNGYGLWIFTDKESKQFVGRGGLRHVFVAGREEIELAYALESEFWGMGLATEMALAILEIGTETLSLDNLVCFTLATNLASQHVMQKIGFQFERDFVHAGQPNVLYRINQAAQATE